VKGFERGMRKAVRSRVRVCGERGLELAAIGVGFAGHVDMRSGAIRSAPNLTFLDGYPFRERLSRFARAPVFIVNDVSAGLYGESRLGAARKARHAIAVFIGTGIGGALMIDRKLYLGSSGVAGNIGNYLLHAVAGQQE